MDPGMVREKLESWVLALYREAMLVNEAAAGEVVGALTGGGEAFCPQGARVRAPAPPRARRSWPSRGCRGVGPWNRCSIPRVSPGMKRQSNDEPCDGGDRRAMPKNFGTTREAALNYIGAVDRWRLGDDEFQLTDLFTPEELARGR